MFIENCFKVKCFIGEKGFEGLASDSSIKQLAREGGCREVVPIFADVPRTGGKGYLTVEENKQL
ncbi:hypothetical protein BSK60_26565 [Paenibacillus odorifer]|nr:hypothetical protein BSK60_26565 [Paenibacillus odorifer]